MADTENGSRRLTAAETDLKDVLVRLARIEQKIDDDRPRLKALEDSVGKITLLSGVISASTAGVIFAAKWLMGE